MRLIRSLQWLERVILVASFSIMVAAMFLQVVNRNFIHMAMPWLEEIAVYSMIYLVMIGTEMGLRDGTQIRITALVDRFSGRTHAAINLIARAIVLIFAGYMCKASYGIFLQQVHSGQTSAALRIPMWFPYLSFVLAFSIILLAQAAAFIVEIGELVTGKKNDSFTRAFVGTFSDEDSSLTDSSLTEGSDERSSDEAGGGTAVSNGGSSSSHAGCARGSHAGRTQGGDA